MSYVLRHSGMPLQMSLQSCSVHVLLQQLQLLVEFCEVLCAATAYLTLVGAKQPAGDMQAL